MKRSAWSATMAVAALLALSALVPVTSHAAGNPCEGRVNCQFPGPFSAEVAQVTSSSRNNAHSVRVSIRLHNPGTAPVILGYVRDSGTGVDELGNRYVIDWRYDAHVSGIGVVTHRQADAQFVLAPGATRTASFVYSRYIGKTRLGQTLMPSLTIAQLELLPGDQVRTVSEYVVDFQAVPMQSAALSDLAAPDGDALGRLLGEKLGQWLQRNRR